jgi:hypothetical protein
LEPFAHQPRPKSPFISHENSNNHIIAEENNDQRDQINNLLEEKAQQG